MIGTNTEGAPVATVTDCTNPTAASVVIRCRCWWVGSRRRLDIRCVSGDVCWVERRVEICAKGELTDGEQLDLEAWVRSRGSDEIESITVETGTVTIRGREESAQRATSVMAVRYPGRLFGALDEALATLRNLP